MQPDAPMRPHIVPGDPATPRRNDQLMGERSIGELFSDLSRELTTLVRQEMALATAEMGHKAARAGRDLGMLALGGAVAYAGFLALLAALIYVLVEVAGLHAWVAALLVGVVVAGIGGLLIWRGLAALRDLNLAPKQTIETLKEDVQWAKQQAA